MGRSRRSSRSRPGGTDERRRLPPRPEAVTCYGRSDPPRKDLGEGLDGCPGRWVRTITLDKTATIGSDRRYGSRGGRDDPERGLDEVEPSAARRPHQPDSRADADEPGRSRRGDCDHRAPRVTRVCSCDLARGAEQDVDTDALGRNPPGCIEQQQLVGSPPPRLRTGHGLSLRYLLRSLSLWTSGSLFHLCLYDIRRRSGANGP
jgi:hypothetical protein